MSLFEFALAPLNAIEPWGNPPELALHWFGLSDGTYHIDLGDTRLLEYAAREGGSRFVEYELARIHEDILAMLPDVLEPIPASVTRHVVEGGLGSTLRRLRKRWEALKETESSLDIALDALGSRLLDTGYLQPNAAIWIWSYGEKVVIEWDNRDRLIDGKPAWTALQGRQELALDEFVEEVRDFHCRLMAAMDVRIREVGANWTRPDVTIDVVQLAAEQIERRRSFDVDGGLRATDWQTVEDALAQMVSRDSDERV